MGAAFSGNTVAHYPAGKQVENDTEVHGVVLYFKIGNIADPNFILPCSLEVLVKQIALLIFLPFFIVALGVLANTNQTKFLHDGPNPLLTDMNTVFS